MPSPFLFRHLEPGVGGGGGGDGSSQIGGKRRFRWITGGFPPRGEHIHHGYWPTDASKKTESKEQAQQNLIDLLLATSSLLAPRGLRVLDVGCGLGGTSRHLASLGAAVTGITISARQVEMAARLTRDGGGGGGSEDAEGYIPFGAGKVRFLELDAEKMGEREGWAEAFDVVWISEALSHVPGKENFFRNAHEVLGRGGKLVIADWFRAEGVEGDADIKAIEGMSLPHLPMLEQGLWGVNLEDLV